MVKRFSEFVNEAWLNGIEKSSKEASVTSNTKYNDPKDFKSNSKKIGVVGGLELHSSESGSGKSHFTWSPKDRKIHHVLHAAEATQKPDGTQRLKFLSAHSRGESNVKMSDVYHHLVKHGNTELVGTGHSPGAVKLWQKLHSHPDLEIHGEHPDGTSSVLKQNDKKYSEKNSTDPEEKKTGRMQLVLKKKSSQ